MQLSPRTAFLLLIDVALLGLCFLHVPAIRERASLPIELTILDGRVRVSRILDSAAVGPIAVNDMILSWNAKPLPRPEIAEFLSDLSQIGDRVVLSYEHSGQRHSSEVSLVPYYRSLRFVLISFVVGIITCFIAMLIVVYRQGNLTATTLHWVLMSLGAGVMLTWGPIYSASLHTSIERSLFFLSYIGASFGFLFFTILYPKQIGGSVITKTSVMFGFAALLAFGMIYYHLAAIWQSSVPLYLSFTEVFNIFRASLFLSFGLGIGNILRSYRLAASREEQERIQWLLWGICIGFIPYLVLHILPQLLFSMYFVDEEYVTITFLAIPISFAISFVRYRMFDVELVINRSLLYMGLSLFVVVAYVLIVFLTTTFLNPEATFREFFFVAGLTILIGIVLNPLRKMLQKSIDETLFPARASFRRSITSIGNHLHRAMNADELFHMLVDSIRPLLFLETIAIYRYVSGRLQLQYRYGKPMRPTLKVSKEHHALFSEADIFAVREAVSFERPDIDFSKEDILRRFGCGVCLPLISESRVLLGVVAVQPNIKSGSFSEEEIDLLRTCSTLTAEVLDRLILEQRIAGEQAERRKAEEMSSLKSEFVASVSHEFQNPLTAIMLHAELLNKVTRRRIVKKSAEIIEGEAGRLSRMVSTVLDVARIEQGIKEYAFCETDLSIVVRHVLRTMKYQLEINDIRLETRLPAKELIADVDPDAFSQALINLISNAVKYGRKGRYIKVSLSRKDGWIDCAVEDRGNGISKESLQHLFERFYRDPATRESTRGVGLGLSLVQHILEAHGGRIEVRSTVGKGTAFTMLIPARRGDGQTSTNWSHERGRRKS